MHCDTLEHDPHVLVANIYLNPDWKQGDGGELQVYPFPFNTETIAPLNGRMVFFSTQTILHRVLPSHTPRCCISMMFEGFGSFSYSPVDLGYGADAQARLAFIFNPKNRLALSMLIYAKEWEASYLDVFENTEQLQDSVNRFQGEVAMLESKFDASYLALLRSCLPMAYPVPGSQTTQ